ncbi:MAG: 3-oxoacyl-[acyl-carrier-protein] synthase III C-terminal domain-containing protein [Alphaproteobacteria bacterium]
MTPVSLTSLALSSPPHILDQEDVIDLCRDLYGNRPAFFEKMQTAYRNAGIKQRRSCVPIDWYREPHGWRERNDLYVENALAILEEAGRQTIEEAGLAPEDIDSVVCISTTGLSTPSLEARLIGRLGLKNSVRRLPIFGLGCAGGVVGMARAADLARAWPGSRVLVLVVELCALTFRPQDTSKANVIASALFGDGAAAAILQSGETDGEPILTFGAIAEHTWPEDDQVMGWTIEEDGFGVLFSRDIPNIVGTRLRPLLERFLADNDLDWNALDGFVLHPGGAKVLEAYADAIPVPADDLRRGADILEYSGNMSAVTVLAVLRRTIDEGAGGKRLMVGLGPGFSVGMGLLDFA